MRPKRLVLLGVLAWGILLWTPVVMFAQGIAGVVKDTSGAVLPGVTVEASSPALIEKVRTVVSDSQGQYSIVELTPGTYTVTFVLPGFSTVRREGIVLTTGFTANVNSDLAVGALAETVVVTSASPIVDTRTITQTSILTDEAIQAIPTGRTTTGFAQLIPGISIAEGGQKFQDVGGLAGEGNSFVIHGSRDNEGMWFVNRMPHSTARGRTPRSSASMSAKWSLQANFDLFNILNANTVLQQRNVYGTNGATWQQPSLVLLARLVKLGFNLNF